MTLEIAALGGVLWADQKMSESISDYDTYIDMYRSALDQEDILAARALVESQYDDIQKHERNRTIFIGVAAGIWMWNVIDALFAKGDTHSYDLTLFEGHDEPARNGQNSVNGFTLNIHL